MMPPSEASEASDASEARTGTRYRKLMAAHQSHRLERMPEKFCKTPRAAQRFLDIERERYKAVRDFFARASVEVTPEPGERAPA